MECNTLEYLDIDYYPETPSFSIGYQSTLQTPIEKEEEVIEVKQRIGFI